MWWVYPLKLLDEFSAEDAIEDPLDLSTDDIIPISSRLELENLQDNITNSVNFSEYRQLINESTLSLGVDELVSDLELLANATQVCYFLTIR